MGRLILDKDGSAWSGPCLCTPAQAIAMSRHRRPRAAARWIAVGLAVLVLAAALPACTNAGASQEPVPSPAEVKRARSAARACPPGHAVIWTSSTAMECVPERS